MRSPLSSPVNYHYHFCQVTWRVLRRGNPHLHPPSASLRWLQIFNYTLNRKTRRWLIGLLLLPRRVCAGFQNWSILPGVLGKFHAFFMADFLAGNEKVASVYFHNSPGQRAFSNCFHSTLICIISTFACHSKNTRQIINSPKVSEQIKSLTSSNLICMKSWNFLTNVKKVSEGPQ